MNIRTAFERRDRVKIKELNITGVVVGLYVGDHDVQYQVRYIFNGAPQTVYFYDFEIKKAAP